MKCPACENKLIEHKVSGIRVNCCVGSCGGFWFHLSQIKKMERVKPGAGFEILNLEKAEGVKVYRDSEHPCPQCKTTLLYRHFFSRKFETEVNQCSKCSGFWVDAGGLASIQKSGSEEKNVLLAEYSNAILNEKISGMNLANQDMSEAARMITIIFCFLMPMK